MSVRVAAFHPGRSILNLQGAGDCSAGVSSALAFIALLTSAPARAVTRLWFSHALTAAHENTWLRKLSSNPDTWETEYIDDSTHERWTLDYPNSEQHRGGSPRLQKR
jgi:Immunity protein 27